MLPPLLKKGDKIGIVAFAKKITREEIQPAIKIFERWGLQVIIGDTIGSEWHQFSGKDEQRQADIQKMLDDTSIKALISARGGYGCVRLIDQIDFSTYIKQPKWIIGFSDVTVFHSHIAQNFHIPTLHATMPVFFKENSEESLMSLKNILFKGSMHYEETSIQPNLCKNGVCKAEIIGGNLSILSSLSGSVSAVETDGKILLLEDLCEYLYHTDRMLQNLKRNGFLNKIAGLIIGSFSDMKDSSVPFGYSTEEIIFNLCKELEIPIFTGFPAGHIKNNKSLVLGQKVTMEVTNGCIKLSL